MRIWGCLLVCFSGLITLAMAGVDSDHAEMIERMKIRYELTSDREPNLKAARKFIAEQPSAGVLIILVTHFLTISAIANEAVSSGEGVLLKLSEDAPYEIVGRLNFDNESF